MDIWIAFTGFIFLKIIVTFFKFEKGKGEKIWKWELNFLPPHSQYDFLSYIPFIESCVYPIFVYVFAIIFIQIESFPT